MYTDKQTGRHYHPFPPLLPKNDPVSSFSHSGFSNDKPHLKSSCLQGIINLSEFSQILFLISPVTSLQQFHHQRDTLQSELIRAEILFSNVRHLLLGILTTPPPCKKHDKYFPIIQTHTSSSIFFRLLTQTILKIHKIKLIKSYIHTTKLTSLSSDKNFF